MDHTVLFTLPTLRLCLAHLPRAAYTVHVYSGLLGQHVHSVPDRVLRGD